MTAPRSMRARSAISDRRQADDRSEPNESPPRTDQRQRATILATKSRLVLTGLRQTTQTA